MIHLKDPLPHLKLKRYFLKFGCQGQHVLKNRCFRVRCHVLHCLSIMMIQGIE